MITPLTESSARSGLPSSLPPTPLLLSHSAAKWFIWLPRHIRRHIGASSYWQRSQTLKHMSTYTHTHRLYSDGSATNILVLCFTYPRGHVFVCACVECKTSTAINDKSKHPYMDYLTLDMSPVNHGTHSIHSNTDT